MEYSQKACELVRKLRDMAPNTVAHQHMMHAASHHHPLLCAMDALYRAAVDYRKRFDAALSEDYVLGPPWLQAATGVRRLLDGDFGPIDNGTVEALFWAALGESGYSEADM